MTAWVQSLPTEWQILLVMGVATATITTMSVLAVMVHAYVTECRNDDRHYRHLGHTPPETDAELTIRIPTVRIGEADWTLMCGKHTTGEMHIVADGHRARHRTHWFAVWQIKAVDLTPKRQWLSGVGM